MAAPLQIGSPFRLRVCPRCAGADWLMAHNLSHEAPHGEGPVGRGRDEEVTGPLQQVRQEIFFSTSTKGDRRMKKFAFAAMLALGVVALMAPPVAMAQDEKPFTIHGEVRTRLEYNNNTQDFADKDVAGFASDDGAGYFPYRMRIAAEGHFTRNVTAWIEF